MWNSWVRVSDALMLILFPRCLSGKESTCQCRRRRRHRFNLWVGKNPWRRKWQPTPVFLPRKSHGLRSLGASLVAQMLKRLLGMRETRVRSLGWEDPLEKETATHSSTLAWRIPWREEPCRLQSMGSQRLGQN